MRLAARLAVPVAAFALGALTTLALGSRAEAPPAPARAEAAPAPARAAAVVEAEALEVRVAPSGLARLRVLARGDRAFVGLMEMEPGARIPLHRDVSEEFVYVLAGTGRMTLDGREVEVRPGTAVYMPSNVPVSFVNGGEPMRALQVFADPTSAAKYDAWKVVGGAAAPPGGGTRPSAP